MVERSIIPVVVGQHAEDLSILWNTRQILAKSGHVALRHLRRFDDRIVAHEDGCVVAGPSGLATTVQQLGTLGAEQVFATAVIALATEDRTMFDRCVAIAEAVPAAAPGVAASLGWASGARLAGIVRDLLVSSSPARRRMGLAACRLHRVGTASALRSAVIDADAGVRAEGLRTAGELGHVEWLGACTAALADPDPECQVWAARSAVLLGDRNRAVHALTAISARPGPHRSRSFRLLMQALAPEAARGLLKELANDPQQVSWSVQGSGIVGDPMYVPWQIRQMEDDLLAPAAGEAFSLITGADLALLDLERPPGRSDLGPNDDPDEANVDLDPDEGMPWPDPDRVSAWWAANSSRFEPGRRYFMGASVTRANCLDVLKNACQRQRMLAAHYLCLLHPGTPLFNTSAPAWRQHKMLAEMS